MPDKRRDGGCRHRPRRHYGAQRLAGRLHPSRDSSIDQYALAQGRTGGGLLLQNVLAKPLVAFDYAP
jgi:hypothetical protein